MGASLVSLGLLLRYWIRGFLNALNARAVTLDGISHFLHQIEPSKYGAKYVLIFHRLLKTLIFKLVGSPTAPNVKFAYMVSIIHNYR